MKVLKEMDREVDRLKEENRRLRGACVKSEMDMPNSFQDYILVKLDDLREMERELRRFRESVDFPRETSYQYAVELMRKSGILDEALAEKEPFYRSMVDQMAFYTMNILAQERKQCPKE